MAEHSTSTTSAVQMYPQRLLEDLRLSGLDPTDVRAKPITPAERQATGSPLGSDGYVLPYFGFDGKPIPHYRVKLWDEQVKYRQPADSPNYIYFPPRLFGLLNQIKASGERPKYLIITEGEKKAAAAVKAGFPAVSTGGIDSWRTRTLILPKDTSIGTRPNKSISVKLPPGGQTSESLSDTLAIGLREIIDWSVQNNVCIVIAYDNDTKQKTATDVQRAAAVLGFEFRFRGVTLRNIRQLVLPNPRGMVKVGLDDYLTAEWGGPELLSDALQATLTAKSAFPTHPNTREYVNKKLQRAQMVRSEQQQLALSILTDMDSHGQRLRDTNSGRLYYFDGRSKDLTEVEFTGRADFAEKPIGRKLYQEYGIGYRDDRVLGWLSTQYSGEEPISSVSPRRIMTWIGDTLYYQINNGAMAKITRSGVEIVDNGTDGVLLAGNHAEEILTEDFEKALRTAESAPIENQWYKVLKETRIKASKDDRDRKLLALLYYISPFFYRWRGTQLPVEITTGEAGSGKSTLFELRLGILTGMPKLRNAPADLRNWSASLANTGALHVTDNLQMSNSDLRQQLSDEICRLITEPNPTVEQRKLYTNNEVVNIPVTTVIGVTAIKMPFQNVDIIQRCIVTELDKGVDTGLTYEANWANHQLALYGGRSHWLAHHLIFVQRLLAVAQKSWSTKYKAKYRLIHMEQLLCVAAQVFNEECDWIANHLEKARDSKMADADWTLSGLVAYAEESRQKAKACNISKDLMCDLADITTWASGQENFQGCNLLTHARGLERYIQQHKHTIATTAGLEATDAGPIIIRLVHNS